MARNPFTGQALKELSELDAALTIAQMNTLAEVVPGTGAASKALVLDANGNVTIPAATIAALIATSFAYNAAVTRTATATGATTGTIADAGMLQMVTVTASDANHIIILPTPTPGTIVILRNGATGYELRSSAPATVAINGGAEANAESAIAASTMVIAVCTTATTWQAIGLAGATLAAVEAAAAA